MATKFELRIKLTTIYLAYGLITTLVFTILGALIIWDGTNVNLPFWGLLPRNIGLFIGLAIGVIFTWGLVTNGTNKTLKFYSDNLQGKKRVNRAGYQYRHLFRMDDSEASQWKSTMEVCFYLDYLSSALGALAWSARIRCQALSHSAILASPK